MGVLFDLRSERGNRKLPRFGRAGFCLGFVCRPRLLCDDRFRGRTGREDHWPGAARFFVIDAIQREPAAEGGGSRDGLRSNEDLNNATSLVRRA